jgi:hypothetical protein
VRVSNLFIGLSPSSELISFSNNNDVDPSGRSQSRSQRSQVTLQFNPTVIVREQAYLGKYKEAISKLSEQLTKLT